MPSRPDMETPNFLRSPFADSPLEGDYDAIAELFLGGGSASHESAPPSGEPYDTEATISAIGPSVAAEFALEAHPRDEAPCAGAAQPQQEHAPVTTSFAPERRQEAVAAASATARTAPEIELLVLGHLPGSASPWASQYASALAGSLGEPIGFLRQQDGEVSIEQVGEMHESSGKGSAAHSLGRLCARCRRVVVRTESSDDALLTRTGLAARVTILTGADEAAVVAAYRLIKQLAGFLPSNRSIPFAAAIMGAAPEEGDRAFATLRQAVATFLDGELQQAPSVHRLGPVLRSTLYRGPGALGDLLEHRHRREQDPAQESSQPHGGKSEETVRAAPARGADELPPHTPTSASSSVRRTQSAAPLSARAHGFFGLETRCPYFADIELAADEDGRLHLLTFGGRERTGDLLAAEAWAFDHAAILAKAEPRLRPSEARPGMHLFTDDPAKLCALLNSPLHVHVLARADESGFVCLPLNEPASLLVPPR